MKTMGWLLVLPGCKTIYFFLLMEVHSEPVQATVMFRSYLAYSKNKIECFLCACSSFMFKLT